MIFAESAQAKVAVPGRAMSSAFCPETDIESLRVWPVNPDKC